MTALSAASVVLAGAACTLDYGALATDDAATSSSTGAGGAPATTSSTGDVTSTGAGGATTGSSTSSDVGGGSSSGGGAGGDGTGGDGSGANGVGGDGAGGSGGNGAGGGDGGGGAGGGDTGGGGAGGDGTGGAPPCEDVEGSCEPWLDPAWTRRRRILVDTTGVTEDLEGFPLHVALDATRIDHAATLAGGADLRFVADDGTTVLPHEVEAWDAAGTSHVWVRLPSVPAEGSGPVTLWLYHGNPAAPAAGPASATWSPAFTSVHHLAGGFTDATATGHDGAPPSAGTTPAAATGIAAGAMRFDGVDDHVVLAGEDDYDATTTLTVTAWVRVASFTKAWQAIVTKGDSAWRVHRQNQLARIGFGTSHDGLPVDNFSAVEDVTFAAWQHVAVTYDGSTKAVYLDGQLSAEKPFTTPIATNERSVAIGENVEATGRHFHGDIDEVRIAGVALPASWIALEHRTVTDPAMLTFSAEQQLP